MSVLILSDDAISRLASFAAYHELTGGLSPVTFAAYLRDENVKAFEERYGVGEAGSGAPLAFDWMPAADPLQVVADAESLIYNVEPHGDLGETIGSIIRCALGLIGQTEQHAP